MSFDVQQPVISESAAAKAAKDGSDFSNPATWRMRMDVPSVIETRRLAQSEWGSACFDGSTVGSGVSAPLRGVSLGTGDFSLWVRFRVPDALSSTRGIAAITPAALSVVDSTGVAVGLHVRGGSSDVAVVMGNSTDHTMYNLGVGARLGEMIDVVLTRASGVLAAYVDGVAVTLSGANTGAGCAASAFINSSFVVAGCRYSAASTQPFFGEIHRVVAFNRGLTASDVTRLMANGVDPSDQWGGFSPSYSSNFATNGDSWLSSGSLTVTGNIDTNADGAGVPPSNDWLRATTTAVRSMAVFRSPACAGGKRHRARCDVFVPSGSPITHAYFAAATNGNKSTALTAGSVTVVENEFLADSPFSDGTLVVLLGNTNSTPTPAPNSIASGSSMYAKNVTVTRVGAFCDLALDVGLGTYIPDRTRNAFYGTASGAIDHSSQRRFGTMTAVLVLGHADISASAATTKILDLPPNCGVVRVEFDRTAAFDAGVSCSVGTAASATKYVTGQTLAATGIVSVASSSVASESSSANTPIYIQKSAATTVGALIVRVIIEIRG